MQTKSTQAGVGVSSRLPAATDIIAPAFAPINDFSRLTGMGRTSIYEALKAGNLTARKLGARTLIDVQLGLAWINSLPVYVAPSAKPR